MVICTCFQRLTNRDTQKGFFVFLEGVKPKGLNTSTETYCVFSYPIEWWAFALQPGRICWPPTQDDSTKSSLNGLNQEAPWNLSQVDRACNWAPEAHILPGHSYCREISLFLLSLELFFVESQPNLRFFANELTGGSLEPQLPDCVGGLSRGFGVSSLTILETMSES